MNKKPSCR